LPCILEPNSKSLFVPTHTNIFLDFLPIVTPQKK
jgi:hypothetical protein